MKNRTGIAFLPGTFPTLKVLAAMYEALPADQDNWNRRKVNDLYFLYKNGIDKGYPIVRPQQFDVKEFMIDNSAYKESDIRVFLYVLYLLAQNGEIDTKFWNIPLQKEQGILPGVEDMARDISKVSGAVKWFSIALVLGGTLYLTWPLLRSLRRN